MIELHKIIKQLAEESSTKEKTNILKYHSDRDDLRLYFKYTLDPYINYFQRVKTLPEKTGSSNLTVSVMDSVVNTLSTRNLTGHAARDFIISIMETLTLEDQVLLKNMINHDANCKVAEGLVNRVWKETIKKFPVMFAEKLNEKTIKNIKEGKDQIIVQKKEDGGRVIILVDDMGSVSYYSRNGNLIETHGYFDVQFSKFPGKVFDGEMLVFNEFGVCDRSTGNGIFNKAVRNTITPEEASKFTIVLWDVIDRSTWDTGIDRTPYIDRLRTLQGYFQDDGRRNIQIVETKIVSTLAECQTFFEYQVSLGNEGAMIKPINMPWVDDRSDQMLKMKVVADATLRVVSVKPHSKNKNMIGSLECVTECGKLEVSVGAGLTEEDRLKDPNYFIGKLVDIQYNAILIAKNSETYSMFLPRYNRIREDLKVADTLEKLKS